jgi:outer membrane protein assembly factor BamB
MIKFSSRLWLGLATLLAVAAVGFALLRPRASFSTSPTRAAQAAAKEVTSASKTADWVMEGANPARTRARSEGVTLPINRQRAMRVVEDKGVGSPVTIAQNIALVEGEHRLRAVDLRSGKERWSFSEAGRYISPAVAGDTVFFRSEAANKGQVFALDLATGKQRWAFTPRRLSGPSTSYWGGHLTSPVVAGGLVFVGAGKELYALDAASGAARWEYGAEDYVVSSATVGDGRIFFSDLNHLYAIDQKTGALAWKSSTEFAIYFAPIVANGTVFLTNGDKLLALGTGDGAKRWETGVAGEILRPAAVQDSRLFVKSTSTLYALDLLTGKELWRSDQPGFISFPAVAGNQLFTVAGSEGQAGLLVLDAETGKPVWTQPIKALASAAPVIAGQALYVRTTDGRVVALYN